MGHLSASTLHSTTEILVNKIKALPPNELSYYLVLLLGVLQRETATKKIAMEDSLLPFVEALETVYQAHTPEEFEEHFLKLTGALQNVVRQANTNNVSMQAKSFVLGLCGVVIAVITGVLSGVAGIFIGLFSQLNIIKGAASGFACGLVLGAALGFAIPNKLGRSRLEEKLIFCINSIRKVSNELRERYTVSHPDTPAGDNPYYDITYTSYQNKAKKYIIDTFFNLAENKEDAFANFLTSMQSFQVCTTPSGLVDRAFDGSLGHHTLIRYWVNAAPGLSMEFGDRRSNPHWVDQAESQRWVSGKKLFEMLALDYCLQDTHPKNINFTLNDFRVRDNDCLTYVNKILIGTGQAPTAVNQFAPPIDTWLGRHIVGPCTQFISAATQEDLARIAPSFAPPITQHLSFFRRPISRAVATSMPAAASSIA